LYILGIFIIFYLAYRVGQRVKNNRIIKKLVYQLSHAAAQIQVRGSIVLILIFVVISQYIGEEVVYLGAFLSGLVLSTLLHRERSTILIKLDGMGFGFFIPFFFIMVGARFDASSFMNFNLSMGWFLLALLGSLYALNVLPAILWRRLFGFRKALAGGFLMASRLSLVIVASTIGMSLGVISPEINASFILLAVVTCFISPYLFNLISPDSTLEGNKTVIIGGSSTAVVLARKLKMHGKKCIIVEKEPSRATEIQQKGLNCILGDGLDEELYPRMHLTSADYVVVDTSAARTNHKVIKLLRNNLMHEKIISWSGTSSMESKMKSLGVQMVDITGMMATTIENLIIRPTTYHALVESFENFSVEEVPVVSKQVDGVQVKDISFHKDAILMMVKRDKSYYIPHGETFLRKGDVLHVFGTTTALEDTRQKMTSS
jgi:Trk K+ transport system NAD-binding subunit